MTTRNGIILVAAFVVLITLLALIIPELSGSRAETVNTPTAPSPAAVAVVPVVSASATTATVGAAPTQTATIALTDTATIAAGPTPTPSPTLLPQPTPTATPVAAPVIHITYPASGMQVAPGQQIAIQSLATAGAGVERIELWSDGGLYATAVNPNTAWTSMAASQVWSSTITGSHTVAVRAYDNLGLASGAVDITIQVQSSPTPPPPAAWLVSPYAPSDRIVAQAGDTVQLAYGVAGDAGIQRTELWVDGQMIATVDNPGHATQIRVQYQWNTRSLGDHTVFLRAYDTLDQHGDSAPLVVGIADRNPPAVSIVTPADGGQLPAGQNAGVQVTASDSKGITKIELWVDDLLVNTWQSASPVGETPVSVALAWQVPAPGTHTLFARAYDSVAQSTTTAAITVNVVATPTAAPTATPILPAATPTPLSAPPTPTVPVLPATATVPPAPTVPRPTAAPAATAPAPPVPARPTPAPTLAPTLTAMPTAGAAPVPTGAARPSSTPAATGLSGTWLGTVSPGNNGWELRLSQTGGIVGGTLIVRPPSGPARIGQLRDGSAAGGGVQFAADFAPALPGATPAPGPDTLQFAGGLDGSGRLVGQWRDGAGRTGSATLSRAPGS